MLQRLRIRDLIKSKGGAVRVAELCNIAQPTVSRWAAQGSIPPKYALLLEQLWGIDADLMYNPWSLDRQAWVSKAEQIAIVAGDYDLRLEAPRGAGRTYTEELLVDEDEVIEWRAPDPSEWDDEPPVKSEGRGRVPSDEELEAILKEMNGDGEG